MNLTGIAADDPRSRVAREFRFAQGDATGNVPGREIVLVGNMLSAGSETVEKLGNYIQDSNDCYARFGRRSPIAWMYRTLRMVAPGARVRAIAVENGGGSSASVDFTISTTADADSVIRVEWGGKRLEVGVSSGDDETVQAAAVNGKVNADPDLPFSSGVSGGVVTFTASAAGPNGDFIMNAVRVYYVTTMASTVSKGSVSAGSVADDYTNALAELARADIYYHVPECTASAGVTGTDGGVGQYCAFVRSESSPSVGKQLQVIFGLDCSQSEGTSVATSSAANAVRAAFYRVHGSDWTPAMVAAHMAGVRWLKEQAYPAASLTRYANGDATPFFIPDPFDKSNRPSATEVIADLNNGVTPICFDANGSPLINRAATSYSVLPGTANKDYRARESHIPSAEDAAWEYLAVRWGAIAQPNVCGSLAVGAKPLAKFNTPDDMIKLIHSVIDVLSSNQSPYDNTPILDPTPSVVAAMKASIAVETRADGFGVSVDFEPVRHNNKQDFLINQGGPAY